ncbi:hypothetical protein [Flavihumibacter petaseus]|uniref:Uncharacterized protein n=1 Tax=Flavihumibacter petaseus NBRC 106054 TaxID=1220578 RepID=A0A0E9MYS0_9BACT|nr:hypothetical protein [Flavihumibacter petaseus]GAO42673.1 hypothetical protein FPE01S_01_16880 [Flavihumibacter petaseus NBRC 106054]
MSWKFLTALLFLFSFSPGVHAQQDQQYTSLEDSLVKYDLSAFTIAGRKRLSGSGTEPSPSAHGLKALVTGKCSDSEIHFSLPKKDIYLHIYFDKSSSASKLDSIFLVTHSHFWVRINREATSGIAANSTCTSTGDGKRKSYSTAVWKAWLSADNRRLYIYLRRAGLPGKETEEAEVTWVITESQYRYRVVDRL